jgi:GTP-binding protein Era
MVKMLSLCLPQKIKGHLSMTFLCSGDRTRTDDLWVMSPTSYQLLHPAMYFEFAFASLSNFGAQRYNSFFYFTNKSSNIMIHKAGFVGIIGKPNVGKSTLMNKMMGEGLSIVTHKAQTTRHRIKGILNHENYQIVFSDTPGMLEPNYLLQQKMMDSVKATMEDADVILYISDLSEAYMEEGTLNLLQSIKKPIIVVINKIDISSQNEINKLVHGWKKKLNPAAIIPVSAKTEFNIETILTSILELLPEAPAFFPKDSISDASERFFVSEIIREKIFLHYQQEIPYSTEVGIEAFREESKIIRISATIFVERDSQKAILIGKGGEDIKRIGTEARIDLEKFLNKKVFLELFVKVEKEWRKNENKLRRFGYSA